MTTITPVSGRFDGLSNGIAHAESSSMNLSSVTSNSSSYPQYNSSSSPSATPQTSLFAQMMKSSGSSSSTQAPAKASGGNANQLLTQLVPSFQASGVQNEAQSLDPMSML